MAIPRRLVAHDENYENQWLKVDHDSRYIENNSEEWQFLFGPNSALSSSTQVVKIAAKFNDDTFDNIQIISYLYDAKNANVANASNCVFNIYKIAAPDWTETLITTINGSQLANNYFYANPILSALTPVDFQGGESIMIEVTLLRLGVVYRDRSYFNHLGIYDSVVRLRNEVQFLDITKKDL
jgi:hypothetical protein